MVTNWIGVIADMRKYEAFVYKVTNLISGRSYIGCKFIHYLRSGGSIKTESDWKRYKGSSNPLKKDILELGEENFQFEILSVHETRLEAQNREQQLQEELDVLHSLLPNGVRAYYNNRINGGAFVDYDTDPDAYIDKCNNISKRLRKRYLNGGIHPMQGKTHPNKGKKLPQTGHSKNKGKIMYTDGVSTKRFSKDDVIPEGWEKGFSKTHGILKSIERIKKESLSLRNEYDENPRKYSLCKRDIPFEKRLTNIFCSKKCHSKSTCGRKGQSGASNPMHKGNYYKTPFGVFETVREAGKVIGVSDVTIRNRCSGKVKNYGVEQGYDLVTKEEFELYIKQRYRN